MFSSSQITSARTITVGQMIIHYLKLEGVTHVFGIPGGGLINFLFDLKKSESDIKYVIGRQETGAAYMADGYHRATGKLGVVIVTTGPGATNALTGTMNAQADGSALLLITGEVDQKFSGLGYLQEGDDSNLNINLIYGAATGYSNTLNNPLSAETITKQALRDALLMPKQAVHLSLPVNVSAKTIPNSNLPNKTSSYRTGIKGAPYEEVKNAVTTLLACKRPLIFIGNSCRQALTNYETYQNLLFFTETYGIPVMTTADGKGLYPESHDLSLRVYGIADCMWPSFYLNSNDPEYDGIMVIGSNLGELSTNSWLPLLIPKGADAPFIQVDVNPKIIARSFEVTHAVVSEVGAFINDMASLIPDFDPDISAVEERINAIAEIKKNSPFINPDSYNSTSSPMEPDTLMRTLQESIPPETHIFIDAGNCVGWAVHYLEIHSPATMHTSLTMGPMGFGVCSVIGAKIGRPDGTCIGIVGDGAFLMNGSEVSTASANKVGAIWIVLYDNGLGMVSQGMNHFFPDENPTAWQDLYEFGNIDLVMFSKSLGAEAYLINSADELTPLMPGILKRANEDGVPQVIVARVNKQSVPPYYNPVYGPKPSK